MSAADEDAVFDLLGAKLYARTVLRKKQTPGKRNRECNEDKKSVRWLESLALAHEASQWRQQSSPNQGAEALPPLEAPLIVCIGDRMADTHELLFRAPHNRTLVGAETHL